jgi:hypothetical protein
MTTRTQLASILKPYYTLAEDGKTPVPVDDLQEWSDAFYAHEKRIVAKTQLRDSSTGKRVEVSTVFLGLDHNWGDGAPILWETLVFGGESDGYMERYSSWDEAVRGHKEIVENLGGEFEMPKDFGLDDLKF